ncbi:MAG: hypothetical protein L0H53_09075 [Candidatus Nitrosocosmicus sp.]|nr:hypothetical protein [Candidatus Nitrosocosmicus sp.]
MEIAISIKPTKKVPRTGDTSMREMPDEFYDNMDAILEKYSRFYLQPLVYCYS